jgi:HEAT repeat protein
MTPPSDLADGRAGGITLADDPLAKGRAALEAALASGTDEALAARLSAERTSTREADEIGTRVLADLIAVEMRPRPYRRVFRVWVAKVLAAIEREDFAAADRWMRAVVGSSSRLSEPDAALSESLEDLTSEEQLGALVRRITDARDHTGAVSLVGAFGPWIVPFLIEQMTLDEPVVHRRHLLEYLGWAGRTDARLLSYHVGDPRWYVVRNLTIALGRTGRATAAGPLAGLAGHADERVRVEAIRSLAVLDREGAIERIAASLTDPSRRVRHAALSLLRANPSPFVVPALVGALQRGGIDGDLAERVVAAIAERQGAEVDTALETLASRRFTIGPGRAVRDAARRALQARGRR